ncbi:hypothetical protein R3P38DRAFT_672746 [Favolaschia claudopus]|uniref:DUF6533 domain-containing protein n=1 Tax=Favolaschia claudopus TaxID=2862362 RepID=A0AAW0EC38_9AGAR
MVAALPVTSVLAMRYMSAVAVALILYDHCLTWVDEVRYIWFNPQAGFGGRLSFLVNRYATEGMIIFVAYMLGGSSRGLDNQVCRNFIWVFAVIGSVSIALQQFSMVVRVYTLWDRRPKIKWIVIIAFAIQTAITTVFSILAAVQMQPHVAYSPVLHMCTISEKPWALPVMTGTLAAFGLFIILMTVVNALDRPYQRQADVVNALLRDGAFMFGFIFLLTVANFLMSLLGSPSDCLVTLVVVWSMYRLVASRMELRVEAIRLIRFSFPANGTFEVDDELESVWK